MSAFETVFHLVSISQGSGNNACGLSQGQITSNYIRWQPPNIGKLLDGTEPQFALRVCVLGLGRKQA